MLGASLLSLAGLATAAEPLTKLADNTTMVPGGSKPFDFFSAPVTAGKFVAWNGATADPGGGIYITELGSERPLAVLVGPGDSMPGGGTINGTGDASLCPDGSAVFFATSDPVPPPPPPPPPPHPPTQLMGSAPLSPGCRPRGVSAACCSRRRRPPGPAPRPTAPSRRRSPLGTPPAATESSSASSRRSPSPAASVQPPCPRPLRPGRGRRLDC